MYPSNTLFLLLASPLAAFAASGTSQIPVLRNLRTPRPVAARASPEREKTCLVDSHGDLATDDSEYVISAFEECNDGGRMYSRSNLEI
jgi:galacturan 1,4-alpha-galacturonidase